LGEGQNLRKTVHNNLLIGELCTSRTGCKKTGRKKPLESSSGSEECRLNHGSSTLVKSWLPYGAMNQAQSPPRETAAGLKTT
jgi:hypothetical protein